MADIDKYLQFASQLGASDLHIAVGSPPTVRINGTLTRAKHPPFTAEQTRALIEGMLTERQRTVFFKRNDLDLSYDLPGVGRYRVNLLRQRRGFNACFRVIPRRIPSLDELGMPPQLKTLCGHHNGLILVTGATGSGKTTTLASLIDHINELRADHILSIEDPIEFIHESKRALVNQRQVDLHTRSFASALRAALRQDPDVIVIGELRDSETMAMAITSAETGHLVVGTIHTSSAARTIDRILDAFPPSQQNQIRSMMAESLRGILCQQLVPKADGSGRVAAVEVIVSTPSLASLIRDQKTFQIPTVMQMGKAQGMRSMDQALVELAQAGVITPQTALHHAHDPSRFPRLA